MRRQSRSPLRSQKRLTRSPLREIYEMQNPYYESQQYEAQEEPYEPYYEQQNPYEASQNPNYEAQNPNYETQQNPEEEPQKKQYLQRKKKRTSQKSLSTAEMGKHVKGNILDLSFLKLKKVPKSIVGFNQITRIALSNNFLTHFPEALYQMWQLQDLILDFNDITYFSSKLSDLRQLRFLSITHNQLFDIGFTFKYIKPLYFFKSLHLSYNKMTMVIENLDIVFPSLEYLYLDHNLLYTLPENLGKLQNLKILDVSHNHLSQVPETLSGLPKTVKINVEGNKIYEPESVKILSSYLDKGQMSQLHITKSESQYAPISQYAPTHLNDTKQHVSIAAQRHILSPEEQTHMNSMTLRTGKRKMVSPKNQRNVRKRGNFELIQLNNNNDLPVKNCGVSNMQARNTLTYVAKDNDGNSLIIYLYTKKNKKYAELANFCVGVPQISQQTSLQATQPTIQRISSLDAVNPSPQVLHQSISPHIPHQSTSLQTSPNTTDTQEQFSILFQNVVNEFKREYILWSFIDADSQFWFLLLNLFAHVGFSNPYVTNVSNQEVPLQREVIGFYFVESASNEEKVLIIANQLRKQIKQGKTNMRMSAYDPLRSVSLVVTPQLQQFWSELLFEPVEWGGNLNISTKHESGAEVLSVEYYTLVKGDPETFVVTIPVTTKIIFHTHPYICYEKINCTLAWPSSIDMSSAMMAILTYQIAVSIVVTREGFYVISIPIWFYDLSFELSPACKELIRKVTSEYFFQGEAGEFIRLKDKREEDLIQQFFKGVKNFTLNTVMQYKQVKNMIHEVNVSDFACLKNKKFVPQLHKPLFHVQFFVWALDKNIIFSV